MVTDITNHARPIVLLGALPEEIAAFERVLDNGRWCGHTVVCALTGVGKTTAAAVTQRMIHLHQPAAIIFTGVAGSLDPQRRIGDIGIGLAAIDADLDIRALVPGKRRGEAPFSAERLWQSDPELVRLALSAPVPGLFPAYIATGSAFLDTPGKQRFRSDVLPELSALISGIERVPDLIEMEGSAVLQVAAMNQIPALAIRAVSDGVDGDATTDFQAFVRRAVEAYVVVVERVLSGLPIQR